MPAYDDSNASDSNDTPAVRPVLRALSGVVAVFVGSIAIIALFRGLWDRDMSLVHVAFINAGIACTFRRICLSGRTTAKGGRGWSRFHTRRNAEFDRQIE